MAHMVWPEYNSIPGLLSCSQTGVEVSAGSTEVMSMVFTPGELKDKAHWHVLLPEPRAAQRCKWLFR